MDGSNPRIYVSGHTGLIGSAIVEQLKRKGFSNLLLRRHDEMDLVDGQSVAEFFRTESPEYVIACAAKVGSIQDKIQHPAEFLYENLQIQNNLIWAAKNCATQKLIFMSSSCIYPSDAPQPMREEFRGGGSPEFENEAYAYAKLIGSKLCEYIHRETGLTFYSCVPTNIYGERDNFDPATAHVVPALIHRFHMAMVDDAPSVTVWGDGTTRREFMHVDDLADAVVSLMCQDHQFDYVNIGTGADTSISELAEAIKRIVGFKGKISFDLSKPSGRAVRVLDVSRLASTGWRPSIGLEEGLWRTYRWFLESGIGR